MKHLVLISGPMAVGKTAVCRELKHLAAPCAFLDGDWCWDMEPFQVTAETKAMVQENIAFLLGQFLRCPAYETVIFCWVMHQQDIIDSIIEKLDLEHCELKCISLMADEISLVLAPAADGNPDAVTVFEQSPMLPKSIPAEFRLKDVEQLDGDGVRLIYTVRKR